jgi:hypothetical protein
LRNEHRERGSVWNGERRPSSYAVVVPAALLLASWSWFYVAWRFFPNAWRGTQAEQQEALFCASRLPFSLVTGVIGLLGLVLVVRLLRRGEGFVSVIVSAYYLAVIVAVIVGSVLFVPFKTLS